MAAQPITVPAHTAMSLGRIRGRNRYAVESPFRGLLHAAAVLAFKIVTRVNCGYTEERLSHSLNDEVR